PAREEVNGQEQPVAYARTSRRAPGATHQLAARQRRQGCRDDPAEQRSGPSHCQCLEEGSPERRQEGRSDIGRKEPGQETAPPDEAPPTPPPSPDRPPERSGSPPPPRGPPVPGAPPAPFSFPPPRGAWHGKPPAPPPLQQASGSGAPAAAPSPADTRRDASR